MKIDRSSIWITRTGDEYAIRDMTESHIQACLGVMNNLPEWREEFKQILEEELKLRELMRNSPLMKALE